MTVKIFRRGSARCIGLLSAFFTILICLYYISMGQQSSTPQLKDFRKRLIDSKNSSSYEQNEIFSSALKREQDGLDNLIEEYKTRKEQQLHVRAQETCSILGQKQTDITTMDEYAKFDFQPEWMKTKEYWDKTFEARYDQLMKQPNVPQLKVIIVPHSHNDPGWLKTFINYFQSDTRQILNYIITKMHEFPEMTFIWSEISFLQLWWDQAHPTKQRALKQLIQQGRFEITTGGWVMTDEANVHVYAMVDQLIEGHQWVKNNLNYTPVTGWSVDPFGHGSTVPYLLSASGFEGTIIQRIHYAWKQWLAKRQYGDFVWEPYWLNHDATISTNTHQKRAHGSLLTHNMPFDIYSIKHSCGPHPFICLNFDFRKVPGEYTEYSIKAQFITDENVESKADLLMEQYSRTASLYPHNVALIPLGDDFRYNKDGEVEQQYTNYKKLIDYVNSHKERYNAEIGFGLPRDYFKAINERYQKFPTLKGDFFVYSDIFTEGRPAYWSGYYTTRPTYKILSRDLEHNLRSLEILYTIAYNQARQTNRHNALRIFEANYDKLIIARRNLGLFQHHDAITGTSKANVMRDYGIRLFESIQDTVKLQENTIELLTQATSNRHGFILSELERESFNKLAKKSPIRITENKTTEFILYNSLAQERHEVVTLRTLIPNVEVHDAVGDLVEIQVNPVWNITDNLDSLGLPNGVESKIRVSDQQFEVIFVAKLPALSLMTYTIRAIHGTAHKNRLATLYCNACKEQNHNIFEVKNKQPGDIQLENYKMRLLFDEQSGFLKTVTKKNMGKPIQCAIKFAAYRSAQFHSGAYLFKTDPEHTETEKDVLEQYSEVRILITSGPIASDVTVVYGPFLAHTVRIFNSKTPLDKAIYIENDIDFEPAPKNRETELFMRFVTEIENGEVPEFYSDLNSFQHQQRVKVPSIGVEGNYFPITSSAFIQDNKLRMTLLTTHAMGAASLEPGYLEVMVDRRTLYDDYRGMGEGVVDSRLTRHKYWLLLEQFDDANVATEQGSNKPKENHENEYQVPSLFANQLTNILNYPVNLYFIERPDEDNVKLDLMPSVQLLSVKFPCDLHLMTLRTLTEIDLPLFPSKSALLVLHRQGYNCRLGSECSNGTSDSEKLRSSSSSSSSTTSTTESVKEQRNKRNIFRHVHIGKIENTLLTGLQTFEEIQDFDSIYVKPMDIRSFNLTFKNS